MKRGVKNKYSIIKRVIFLLFVLPIFQACFSYKTINYSEISNDKKQKIVIEKIDKINIKGKLISVDEKKIILTKKGELKKINKEEIQEVSVRKFSISKTAGGIIGSYGAIVFILPIIIVLAAFI